MTQPSLDQYPGYFPPAKKPFWTRTKASVATGAAALVVGLLIGASGGGESAAPKAAASDPNVTQQTVDAAVAAETAKLRQQISALRDQKSGLQQRLTDQKTAAANHLAAVRQNLKAQEKKAVAAARADERAKAAESAPKTFADTGSNTGGNAGSNTDSGSSGSSGSSDGGTDPRFGTCGEANDAGYGPYYQGQDPEYDWYEDRDGDGIDCEP